MQDFVPLAALAMTVFTVVSLLRYLSGRQWQKAGTIVVVWVSGILVVWLFSLSVWADQVSGSITGGVALGDLNLASLVILGLQVGSTATGFNEIRGAIDSSGSTSKPALFDT